jgi:hypothetical protein
MKRTTLILILLISLLNDAELKVNILGEINEEILDEPILTSNLQNLRTEASKAIKNLFGISLSFSKTVFDKEMIIYLGNPKITVKLSSSCSTKIQFGKNSGFFTIKNGVTVNQKGTKVSLSSNKIITAGKYLKVDFSKMTDTLSKKLQGAVNDGTVSFSFSPLESKISISFTKSLGNGETSCDGTLTITIKPGNYSKPQPQLQPAFDPEAVQKATVVVSTGGAIAIGAVVLFKLLKGALGCAVGGPVGCLVGVAV